MNAPSGETSAHKSATADLFSFPVYQLDGLSDMFSQMECERDRQMHKTGQNHSRTVYFDRKQGLYYKTWPKDYIFGNAVVEAFSVGFYDRDLVPAFVAFIVDSEGLNRGYVMRAGEPIDTNVDTTTLADQLIQRAKSTRYFFFDLMPHNIIRYDGRLCVIDLESVVPLCNLHCLKTVFRRKIEPETYSKRLFEKIKE